MEEDYVSFKTAKLLKEKGFDEKCRYVWKLDKANDPQDTDGISKLCAEQLIDGSFMDNSDINKVAEYEDWFEDYHKAYLCPTHQMVMKWLREEHNLYIVIVPESDIEVFHIKGFYFDIWTPIGNKYDRKIYRMYKEAVEAAIKYCLENLI